MPLKSDNSFENREQNTIIGKDNLAYTTSDSNFRQGSMRLPLDYNDIYIDSKHENNNPHSYTSIYSSRASLPETRCVETDEMNLTTSKNNYKNQIANNMLNTNLSVFEEKLKTDQLNSVIFKSIGAKEQDPAQKPKKKEKDAKAEKDVTFLKLFRYADCFDKLLMLVGIACALLVSAIHPIMFLIYGRLAGTFVDFKKYQYIQSIKATTSSSNLTAESPNSLNPCFEKLTNHDTNFNERVNTNIIVYVGVGFGCLLFSYLLNVCFNTAAERQIQKLRNELYQSIIRQDYSFFDKNTAGDLNEAIIGNIETFKIGISYKVADFISLLGRAVACYYFSIVSAWKFSIVFLGLTPFLILTTMLMVLMFNKYTIEEFKAYGKAGSIAQEALSSIRTVLSLGVHKKISKVYASNLNKAEKMAQKKGLLTGLLGGISSAIFYSIFAVGIYYGVYLNQNDCANYNVQSIMQSFFSIITATQALGQALPFLKELAEAKGVAKKIYNIIDTKSQIDVFSDKGGIIIDNLQGSVDFESVFFHYPQRPEAEILKGLDLKIPAGLTVALVGSSGGGKSTVVSLLQRFYNPVSGIIKIDGHLIQELDLNWWRSQMALVAQEPILFTTSIKENIRLGRLDATDEEIVEAAKQANAHNFIIGTTHKYETQVGERGTQLSGGQKQRIAIARALLRNPKILLLDEATSALDSESEKLVQDALDKAKVGRTTIIIAHRLSTIRNADLIVTLTDGQFKEMGNHDELMAKKGLYYELVNTQATKKMDKKDEKNNIKKVDTFKDESDSSDDDEETDIKENSSDDSSLSKKIRQLAIEKKKKKLKFKYELKLWKLQLPDLFWIIIGTIAQILNGAIFSGTALVSSKIFHIFTNQDKDAQTRDSLMYMGILFGFAGFVTLTTTVCSYSFSLVGARLTKKLRTLMFEAMLKQEIGFHDLDENKSSILATTLSSRVTTCKGMTSDKLSLLAQAFAGVGFGIIYSSTLNFKLTLLMCAFIPVAIISGLISGKDPNANSNRINSFEESGRLTTETVENIKTIISLGRENHFVKEFKSLFNKTIKKVFLMIHVSGIFYSLSQSVIFFIQSAAYGYGWILIRDEKLEITSLYQIYACLAFSSITLGRVYSQMPDQKNAKYGARTAFRIIERKSKIDSMSDEGLKPDDVYGEIKFENVHFQYPNRPDIKILNGFNLVCKKGQTNALVGPSGCGKSTTIALLLRFYDVDAGTVYLDGRDIRTLNVNWLRSKIALVSQEPTLFNLSIFENVCYGDITREKIPINEVMGACRESNINNRIEKLPDNYDTIVGTKGGQLSGGEKQRIAIARALIRKPAILLLDEATSALDIQSEQGVQSALDKAQHGRTCIVIAHRLSTIQNSDKISVVKDGMVLEEGNHLKLMENKQFYYKLQTQSH